MGKDCSEEICANEDPAKAAQEMNKNMQNAMSSPTIRSAPSSANQILKNKSPLNAVLLGRVTWPLLHRLSLLYPDDPSDQEKQLMRSLIHSFSWVYPCSICATDFRKEIEATPVDEHLGSKTDFALWLCEQHNKVNKKLGKE